jgi:hypothetical protein
MYFEFHLKLELLVLQQLQQLVEQQLLVAIACLSRHLLYVSNLVYFLLSVVLMVIFTSPVSNFTSATPELDTNLIRF